MRIFRWAGALTAGVCAGGLALGAALPAQAATLGWRLVYSKHYGAAANNSFYGAPLVFSKDNAWALGGTNEGFGYAPSGTPVAVHWNGRAWSGDALPAGATGYVTAASATSATDIWAVTQYSAYVLRWNGARWSIATHLPANGGEVTGITAISSTDVWVFGGGGAIGGIGTWHYNGKTWLQWKGAAAGLERGSAVSGNDIWAVGGALTPDSSVEHFNGKTWQTVTPKGVSGAQFGGVEAVSDHDVYVAVGSPYAPVPAYLLRYNGASWSRLTLPWKVGVASLPIPDGHGGYWLLGYTATQSYLMHRSAAGAWSRIIFHPPGQVAPIPGSGSWWAANRKANTAGGTNATIWAYGTV